MNRSRELYRKVPEYMLFEKDPERKVATITFNRPDKLNAVDTSAILWIAEKMDEIEWDDDVKVVVFKGAGPCFGTGYDVGDLGHVHGWGEDTDKGWHSWGGRRPAQRERLIHDDNEIMQSHRRLLHCDKLTVAQVHGYCYGAHFLWALECDVVIAAENAQFTHPGYRYIGPTGNLALLILTLGLKGAKTVAFGLEPLTAQKALEAGLVHKVVPLDRLEEEVAKAVDVLTKMPLDAICIGKAHFEGALNAMGVQTAYTLSYITHSLQTNIRYEPDEFNLFKQRKDKGISAAIKERERHFAQAPLGKSRTARK